LRAKPLPADLEQWRSRRNRAGLRIGLSLRSSTNFAPEQVIELANLMHETLPADAYVVPLSLHPSQDDAYLNLFATRWSELNRHIEVVDTSRLERPSQWINLLTGLDLTVAMRLHCGILGLISAVPTVPIAYDPKVSKIAAEFELPTLNLTKANSGAVDSEEWRRVLKTAVQKREIIKVQAAHKAESARKLACQNFALLAKILGIVTTS
jgi:polysaccharide pyruvyl transferase WcaK-like protein